VSCNDVKKRAKFDREFDLDEAANHLND